MAVFSFTVLGLAQPAGSKRSWVPLHPKTKQPYRRPDGGIVVSTVDANPNSKPWKELVARVVSQKYKGPLLSGALMVTFCFYRPRPEGHYGKTGLNKKGRETPFPITRPDVLKLTRGVEDALTGVVWTDDAVIVRELLSKDWGEARVDIRVENYELRKD